MPSAKAFWKLAGFTTLGGALVAGILFPVVGGFGVAVNKASETADSVSAEVLQGDAPAVSTMVDANGKPIAWLYDQRRFEVPSDKISNYMKLAQVSIEDRRFAQHHGVDWQGTIRAFLTNTGSGQVEQGASTIDQQYIKNYQLLVVAQTDAERRKAVETTVARKLREIRMALTLDKTLTKDEILTRYLNLVSFGNGSYGVQDAAETYFGVNAADLSLTQAAMLAGMVQSPSRLNPYTNADAVTTRRNAVLESMVSTQAITPQQGDAAMKEPLGVLPQPNELPRGCIAAGNRGFFCDYALKYLENAGISQEQINKGGYLIKTTLDPSVQDSVKNALDTQASPSLDGIAEVMNIIAPGQDNHKVLAMASSRTYGLDTAKDETVQPEPFAMEGDGAGSIFKLFTVSAAMEKGLGLDTTMQVPPLYIAKGMGHGGAVGCPADSYCVKNAGKYAPEMSLTQALATSPNTAFVKLLQQVGVGPAVDMAVRLGLRSYADPGSSGVDGRSMAQIIKDENRGSFTLGPTPVNPLELSNVAATLASGGKWCPPTPISGVFDRNGKPVPITEAACEQVVSPGLANTLANGMGHDHLPGGTSAGSAAKEHWTAPVAAKTGTTETYRSSAFLAFTPSYAGVAYVYNDGSNPGSICTSPLRPCGEGNVYGGNEPAAAWYQAMQGVIGQFPPPALPPEDPTYVKGSPNSQVPNVTGLTKSAATAELQAVGFQVNAVTVTDAAQRGNVVSTAPSGSAVPGSTITINVSDGTGRRPAPKPTTPVTPPTISVPGLPPIQLPPLSPPAPSPSPGN
ncbi:penicillin-binding protein [Corynebacteriales bacterium D3-21]|uniref:Penicillin-binding protein n=1 Tax=Speluncibacter jeojiensis TaxID=2710754 RepID=A0A9X4M7Z9_9ACTN|nr:transglycosylase domain-containing protein [Rhodococcus sp. D2-41]MDG3016968.1 penicillin-binding protein [Corynebacteriales bacterium D3-21]